MLPVFSVLAPIINKVLDFIPDPAKKAEAQLKLQQEINANEQAILTAFLAADKSQTDINIEEAKSSKLFVSGWRPFVGWTCAVGVSWAFVFKPVLDWTVALLSRFFPQLVGFTTPILNTGELLSLLLGLLGMGGFRMMEKKWGVANK